MLGKWWTGGYCRYFQEAVLPLDPALEAALTAEGPRPDFKLCPVCGGAVAPGWAASILFGDLCKDGSPPPTTELYAKKAGLCR